MLYEKNTESACSKWQSNEVKSVLDSASFKALSILEPSQITAPNINYAFECNKSVLCQDFNLDSINTPKIPILVTSNKVEFHPHMIALIHQKMY